MNRLPMLVTRRESGSSILSVEFEILLHEWSGLLSRGGELKTGL